MALEIALTYETVNQLHHRMDNSRKVFYIRFGDNDVFQMAGKGEKGKSIKNRPIGGNQTQWTPRLQKLIRDSFRIKHPDYLRGVTADLRLELGMSKKLFAEPKSEWIEKYVRQVVDTKKFYSAIAIHYYALFRISKLKGLLARYENAMFVGGADLEKMQKLFTNNIKVYVKTPTKNAPSHYDAVLKTVLANIEQVDCVILACGQLTRALAAPLWKHAHKFHCIDVGSIVDIFSEQDSRRWAVNYGPQIRRLWDKKEIEYWPYKT